MPMTRSIPSMCSRSTAVAASASIFRHEETRACAAELNQIAGVQRVRARQPRDHRPFGRFATSGQEVDPPMRVSCRRAVG
jgi:hypothetical protein